MKRSLRRLNSERPLLGVLPQQWHSVKLYNAKIIGDKHCISTIIDKLEGCKTNFISLTECHCLPQPLVAYFLTEGSAE